MTSAVPDYALQKDNRRLGHLPGRYGLPLVGETFSYVVDPYTVTHRRYRRYGPVSKASLTFQRLVVALGPEFNQELMLDRDQGYSALMGYDGPLGDFFAGGLLLRDFAEHKMHRRIMQSSFKIDNLRGYIDLMNPIIERQTGAWGRKNHFLFYPNIKTLLLDVGARVFLGLDMEGPETRALNRAFLAMNEGVLALVRRDWPGLTYRRGMNGRRELERFFAELVPTRRGQGGSDMATLFANETTAEGAYFTVDEVVGHLIFLLLAAHDTTTSALTMACYYLARDPELQEQLREELRALHKSALDYDDLATAVPGLDACFKEVLRLHPPVPNMMRRTVKPLELGGYELAPHTLVQISPLYTHRMERWWQRPHDFDPTRFVRGEHKQHNFQWVPFGGGAHKCIGLHFADMQFKATLAQLLLQYRLEFLSPKQHNGPMQHFPFARPRDKLPLKLVPVSR